MPQDTRSTIDIYVDIFADPTDERFPWSIAFFKNPQGTMALLDGRIVVPSGGAMIYFRKLKATKDWNFHDLTIHPMGRSEAKVDLKWIVQDDLIRVHDPGTGKRTFSYAISAYAPDPDGTIGKIYFDPQLENRGGG